MGLGCLGTVAVCGLLGAAALYALPLPPSGRPTLPRVFAALIGTIGGLGLSSVASIAIGHGRGAGSLRPLLARARADGPAADGALIIATGTARAERPLVSPIGGVPCVAYDYRMTERAPRAGADDAVPVYWGYASLPFTLDGRTRSYRVSAAALLTERATPCDGPDARTRARDYVRSTRWETVEYRMLGALDTIRQRLGDTASDGTRKDFAADGAQPIDVALLALEETIVPVGTTISAFGTWSATYGMVVPPPSPLPGSHVVLARGGPEALKRGPGVPQSTTANVVGAVVMLAVAAILFWFAALIMPTVEG